MGTVTRVFRCPYIEGNVLIELMEGTDSMLTDLALKKYDTLLVKDIECID